MNDESSKYGRSLIFSGEDKYGLVEVVEDHERRSMHFGTGAKQSEMSLHDPFVLTEEYTRLMAMSLLFNPLPKTILTLGLGGGSLPKFLWKHFPECQQDIVEQSPLVVELAYRYFDFPKSPQLKIWETDALEFIRQSRNQYDLIFIDLFHGEGISALIGEKNFFKNCKKLLKNQSSVLVWNTWKQTPDDLMLRCVNQIGASFGNHLLILPNKLETSYIFFIFLNDMSHISLNTIVHNAAALEKQSGLHFNEMLKDLHFFEDKGTIKFKKN